MIAFWKCELMNGYIASLWVCSCVCAFVELCMKMSVWLHWNECAGTAMREFRYCIACSSLVCHVLVT